MISAVVMMPSKPDALPAVACSDMDCICCSICCICRCSEKSVDGMVLGCAWQPV